MEKQKKPNKKQSKDTYQTQCDNGNLLSCLELSRLLEDKTQREKMYQDVCYKGYGLACHTIAETHE